MSLMHARLRRLVIFVLCLGFQPLVGAEASSYRYQSAPDPARALTPIEIPNGSPTLPAGWRFHPRDPKGDLPTGRGNYTVTYDPTTGRILESYREGDVEVRQPLVLTPEEYNQVLTQRTVKTLWRNKAGQTRSVARGTGSRAPGLFRVEIPVEFPKIVRSIVGDGAPNIEVSGSETITLSGTSDWTVSDQIQSEFKKQSAFPSLEMKQELNVNLTGSIGDKIKVDVDQSSNVTTSVDNKVKLRYEGGEDDMIRTVELGNTNLSVEGASFRQEGLFGVKTVAKLGNVDVQAIASKQEGKTETARFTPSGEAKRIQVRDLDYIKRTYYLIADKPVKIDEGSFEVYRDDRNGNNNSTAFNGLARLDPTAPPDSATNPEFQGWFNLLTPGEDYSLEKPAAWATGDPSGREIYVLKLRFQLQLGEILAVAYTDVGAQTPVGRTGLDFYPADPLLAKPDSTILVKTLKAGQSDIKTDPTTGRFDVRSPWYPTLFYELRNYYDLQGRDISSETFTLKVKSIQLGESDNPEEFQNKALIEHLGLDQKGLPGSGSPDTPDGRVDDKFIDYSTGILFFPDIHPFDPVNTDFPDSLAHRRSLCATDSTLSPPLAYCFDDSTRNLLRRDAVDVTGRSNPLVYYVLTPDPTADARYILEAEFKSSLQGFFLGRYDITEDSEQVKVDGIPQRRGVDYTLDYTTGQLTFVKPPGPNQTISVDYSYAPGIGSTQLTLLGGSASYVPGPNLSITSSLLYDSRGAQEQNPKLGEEPARSIIGDLASVVTFRPVWMTELANVLPGVRTNAASTLNIQGHAGMSAPNPNTAGEAYIDDMEGNRESNTVALGRSLWFWSSAPKQDFPTSLPVPVSVAEHSRLEWYNARGVNEGDLKPVLKDEEGGDTEHTVLELNVKPPTNQSQIIVSNWTGITQSLSTSGQDFSRLKYLEVWVNDFTRDHTTTRAKLHINFGRVSEDAFWDPNSVPNDSLDTEDKNGDGKLDRNPDDLAVDEDTGLDRVHSVNESGYNASSNPDPHGDDYHFDPDLKPPDYSRINNLEANGTGEQTARPDTEDLNRDGFPDFENEYFEAVIDLADTSAAAYVSIDVARDYANNPNVVQPIALTNGWRLYRIPLADAFKRYGAANWQDIQHMRLWVNGMTAPTRLQIGGIELVGNRWLAQAIDTTTHPGLELIVGSRNNKDDADVYSPPYDVENTAGGTATRREQSLALVFRGLQGARPDSVLAFKTIPQDANGLGWTQYREIRFWHHGSDSARANNLRILARFGPDTVNYYEYSAPVRVGWTSAVIPMERLSSLKSQGTNKIDTETGAATEEIYRVVGNPSFTRILRVTFGVTSVASAGPIQDEVWVNDLRLSDVRRDRGIRGDVTVQANFADVMALNVSYENQDEDFFRVGTGSNQGTGVTHVATRMATTFNLDKLMPRSQVQLPLRVSLANAKDIPKFRTGSDVVLDEARSDLETREQSTQAFDLSYRRTGPRKGIARYTLDAISGALGYTRTGNRNTSSVDSTWEFRASSDYDLPVGGGGIGLGSKMKINFLPDVLGFNMAWQSRRSLSYSRKILDETDTTEVKDSLKVRSDVVIRNLIVGATSSWTPLSSVRLRLSIASNRNMLLREEGPFGFNQGTENDQRRLMELNYAPRWLALLSPSLNMTGTYHQSRPEIRLLESDPVNTKNIDNRGSARVTFTVPFGRLGQRLARPPNAKGGGVSYFHPVRAILSRLQDIQATFNMERNTNISRVVGDAGFGFETGFTEVLDPGLVRLPNSVYSSNRSYTSGASTTFRPSANVTVDVRGDHRLTFSNASNGERRTLARTLPDLKARWLDLQRLLGLQGPLSTMSLNSGFVIRVDESGPGENVEIRTTTTNWQPLLGWNLAWRNGLRADVSTTVVEATSIDQRLFGQIGERQTINTDVRFSKTFAASRGFRLPFSKNPIRLPNDLNLNLNFSAASDKKVTKRPQFALPDLVELDQDRWSVTSATTYNFTQAISGGFNLGFRQNADNKTSIKTRGLTIALNGQFRF